MLNNTVGWSYWPGNSEQELGPSSCDTPLCGVSGDWSRRKAAEGAGAAREGAERCAGGEWKERGCLVLGARERSSLLLALYLQRGTAAGLSSSVRRNTKLTKIFL